MKKGPENRINEVKLRPPLCRPLKHSMINFSWEKKNGTFFKIILDKEKIRNLKNTVRVEASKGRTRGAHNNTDMLCYIIPGCYSLLA